MNNVQNASSIPSLLTDFASAPLPAALIRSLERMGFTTPTPIQAEAIPVALAGKDILGSAQTGTGKTGAFGIPLVAHLLTHTEAAALILLPTRELASQVMDALQKMIGQNPIRTALLIGGDSMSKQLQQLRAKPRLIVGTPGRINDLLLRKTLQLNTIEFLVLDETDRMLDMGFGIQLEAIARHLTAPTRQTMLFSATLPKNIMKLASSYLTDPVRIAIGHTHETAADVVQEHARLQEAEKYPRLLRELDEREGSVIVFVKTKHGADKLADKLSREDHQADALHGDLRQNRRDRVIANFRKKKYRILVATDVAARGLDIPHIEHVINYDLPQSPEDYIHRIGRTARAGAKGHALTLLAPQDAGKWRAIQRLLNPSEFSQEDEYEPRSGRNHKHGKPAQRGHRNPRDARSGAPDPFAGFSRSDRPERSAGRFDKAERGERSERNTYTPRSERGERTERGERNAYAPRAQRSERFASDDRPQRKVRDHDGFAQEAGFRPRERHESQDRSMREQRTESRWDSARPFKRREEEGSTSPRRAAHTGAKPYGKTEGQRFGKEQRDSRPVKADSARKAPSKAGRFAANDTSKAKAFAKKRRAS